MKWMARKPDTSDATMPDDERRDRDVDAGLAGHELARLEHDRARR